MYFLISDQIVNFSNKIEKLEYDYEHYNHGSLRRKIKNIVQSPLIHQLPIRSKLYLKYYQIFFIQFWDLYTVPDNIIEIFDEFNAIDLDIISELKLKIFYICIKVKILIFQNEFDHANKLLGSSQDLLTQLEANQEDDYETRKFIGLFYYISVQLGYFKNNSNSEQLDKITKCFTIWNEINNDFYIYLAFALEFDFYNRENNPDTRLDKINLCLTYFKQKDSSVVFVLLTMTILTEHLIFMEKINLKKAQEVNNQAIDLLAGCSSEQNFEIILYLKARIYNAKGILYDLVGDFNSALTYYLQTLECMNILQEKLEWNSDLAVYLGNIGEIYTKLGNFEKALDFQIKSYVLNLKASKKPLAPYYNDGINYVRESCYQLARLYLILNDKVNAGKFINELKQLSNKAILKNQVTPLAQYKLARAFLLIKNTNFKDIVEAKSLLREVIQMPVRFELITDALIPLIEIVVKEYQTFQNDESLEEFRKLSYSMTKLVEHSNSVFLQVNFLILEGKIAFIEGEYLKSEELYENALKIAEDFNLERLITRITNELSNLQNYLYNATKSNSKISIKARLDAMDIEKYITEVSKAFKIEF